MIFSEENIFRRAIEQRRLVRFYYEGVDHYIGAEPYALYVSMAGKAMIYAVQTSYDAEPLQPPIAKVFSLSNISCVMLTATTFSVDPAYFPQKLNSNQQIISSV